MKGVGGPLALCILSFGALLASLALLFSMHASASSPDPSPNMQPAEDGDGFPVVDWDYWMSINPDVIGWISIPETNLSLPIAQAPDEDPQKYLTHDVYGDWNYLGCPYLDAECAEAGLEGSPNAVVFAHNLGYGDDSMFAPIASFTDQGFMSDHPTILLQTPTKKMRFNVLGASCTEGSSPSKRTAFQGRDDLLIWLNERLNESQAVLGEPPANLKQALTLCTCSYNRFEDERTILFSYRA